MIEVGAIIDYAASFGTLVLTRFPHEVAEVPAPCTGAVQEVHLVAVHVLCHAFDAALGGDR